MATPLLPPFGVVSPTLVVVALTLMSLTPLPPRCSVSDTMRHLTLRLPEDLAERIAEARGFSSLNAEIVRRLEQSFGGALGEPEPNAREAGSTFLPPPAKDEADTSPAAVHTGHRTGAGITEASGSPSAKTASEVAASIAGVNLGPASLAKEATPFSKGAQAGRGKT